MVKIEQMGIRALVWLLLVAAMGDVGRGDMLADEKECADDLADMASCIPFVSGRAKEPTKKCCDDVVKVRGSKPKCLCVLILESTDPAMAMPVNTTLALQMPAACNFDAKISDCPSILKLPPDSPDAKIFREAGGNSSSVPPAILPASASHGNSTGDSSKESPSSNRGGKMESFGAGSVILLVVSVLQGCLVE